DAVAERRVRRPVLTALVEVAFEEEAHECWAGGVELAHNLAADGELALRVFPRVAVRAVDHDRPRDALFVRERRGTLDVGEAVVRARAGAAENEVAVRIPLRPDDAGHAVDVDADKTVG